MIRYDLPKHVKLSFEIGALQNETVKMTRSSFSDAIDETLEIRNSEFRTLAKLSLKKQYY